MKTALEKTLAESFVELRLSRNRHLQGMRLESSAAGLFMSCGGIQILTNTIMSS